MVNQGAPAVLDYDGYGDAALKTLLGENEDSARVLLVAAHPDDEAIGAGGLLRYLRRVWFLHVTDGAPKNMRAARARGFASRTGYARARRGELLNALSAMPCAPMELFEEEIADLDASYNLRYLSNRIMELIERISPDAVLTHPYEGGHPDHDSAAFAVHTAVKVLEKKGVSPPRIIEYASYHSSGGKLLAGAFLPADNAQLSITLSDEERLFKKAMFDCYVTQGGALRQFPIKAERFRAAPQYDFTEPPHEGRLFYQNYDWGIPGKGWCALADRALKDIGIEEKKGFSVNLYSNLPDAIRAFRFRLRRLFNR